MKTYIPCIKYEIDHFLGKPLFLYSRIGDCLNIIELYIYGNIKGTCVRNAKVSTEIKHNLHRYSKYLPITFYK